MEFVHCVLCGGSVLHGEGPKRSEHCQIDGACIVQEDANDLLDKSFVRLGEGRGFSSPLAYCTFCPYVGLTGGYG